MVDFRWRFESFAKAETAAAALVALRQRAEVDLLPVELRRPPRFRMST